MTYECLLKIAEENGIELLENDKIGELSGLCVGNILIINSKLQTNTEKACVLAEELGHYYTTVGNILDQSKIENRKQERRARAWGYEKVIPIYRLIDAYLHGVSNRYELSEFLEVTEKYLADAINYYYEKYGLCIEYNGYLVYFKPLAICKMEEIHK